MPIRRTSKPVAPQPMMVRLKNSLHRTDPANSKVHKPIMSRSKVHGEKPSRIHGLRQHRLNKKYANLPKQNIGLLGRVKLLIAKLMNFTKLNTNKMITNGRPVQPKRL